MIKTTTSLTMAALAWIWDELTRLGADIVVWPTQSPQTVAPALPTWIKD